ncbi:class I SAM-dependent methyltransferase [Sinorhizobium medicae]|uniref:Class I SAM-dependent methyltransferase n=1 Tax=Sinorhizobium medicae TaxID=110321 RepID=A0A6G1WE10_9HYPH|nr:class I SAM-dependent methyltransferase [Sinorhizobium medicae]MQV96887.1 class I SAM-dependent methyltransferase [Sinorhizobium medicae]MQW67961.1 class I SAM-dependent methyltransferase [Sinorhizobium medicae]MQX48059.1 class I SAM-dependent methyltransferase [Sinorhizobium medicae]MQX82007.1 class I SAM-dependent methyltransferase [Sinorhizobium medicae]RVJ82305.1 class I SAM-dependent methyltransferase [Sinorhizobium medicae]
MTNPLADKIKALIRANGPISVTDYFSLCLADPQHGYYRVREPFGAAGDFTTAPEISQLFGEMIGIFLVHAWQQHGAPANAIISEIGPGRGTMMSDMLRVIRRLAPTLYGTATVHLVETSDRLREVQAKGLAEHEGKIRWHESFDSLPSGFLLLAANELFDAIPIRQFVRTPQGFRERMIGLDTEDRLTFAAGAGGIDPTLLPTPAASVPEGTIFEIAPARDAVMAALCERLRAGGGTALIIDYGHLATGYGDTLQAVRNHEYDPPLANPGFADMTSHVDFEQLASRAKAEGVQVNGLVRQGDFLVGLGLLERAAALGRDKGESTQEGIRDDVERLAGSGPGKMGELFKVLVVSRPEVALAPFQKKAP